jgi:hypothetical protein
MSKYRTKLKNPALVALVAGVLGACAARADVIVGPTLSTPEGYAYSGVGFTANVLTLLTSFTFENEGAADVVDLVDPLGNILDSVSIPAGFDSDVVTGINWVLAPGTQYYLLQTTQGNGLYTNWGLAAPSDTQITMTNTGDFSSSPVSANFSYGGGGPNSGTAYWADFNNITTINANSPEPATFFLVLPLGAALLLRKRLARV